MPLGRIANPLAAMGYVPSTANIVSDNKKPGVYLMRPETLAGRKACHKLVTGVRCVDLCTEISSDMPRSYCGFMANPKKINHPKFLN